MSEKRIVANYPETIDGVIVSKTYDEAIERLKNGEETCIWEYGNNMFPFIMSKEYCRLTPIRSLEEVRENDVVLCDVKGRLMIRLVQKIYRTDNRGIWFLITTTTGNTCGITNAVYGVGHGINVFQGTDWHQSAKKTIK